MTMSLHEIKWLGKPLALYKPLDGEQTAFHKCLKEIRWFFGGNQSGKTHTNMTDLAQLVLNVHPFHTVSKGLHWCAIES